MSQPKVFEFAKEIGMETLALMDKIREWKLPVRSHMAELDPDLMEQIKTRLKDDGGKKPTSATKKKVAKKAEPAAAGATSSAGTSKVEAKPAAKKIAKKALAPAPMPEAPANAKKPGAPAVVVKKAVAKVVIRRKSEEEDVEAEVFEPASHTEVHEEISQPMAAAEAPAPVIEEEEIAVEPEPAPIEMTPAPVETPRKEAPPAAIAPPIEVAPAPVAAAPAAVSSAASTGISSGVSSGISSAVSGAVSATISAAAVAPIAASAIAPVGASPTTVIAPVNTEPVVIGGPGGPIPGRKREVVMTSQGPTSGIRSEPRRNIVGRMDLSRVQPPPTSAAHRPPGTAGPGGGPGRPMSIGAPRALRTGFVAPAPVELPTDTAERRGKFENNRRIARPATGPGTPAPGASTTGKEEEIKQFSATEFRKREMVFQPKKKKGTLGREGRHTQITKPKASKMVVKVDRTMKLSDLANEMGLKAAQLTKTLMQQGVTATMNTELDFDTIALIAPEFGFEAQNVFKTVAQLVTSSAFGDLAAAEILRAPVVTIMGHVDHGKTSLLDAIRKARVAAGEAGGITQHIGAYQVTTDDGHLITFIDTPGHEAFTAMRARGANVTDIAVIVVAADDGAMPQTVEAINHAKAAGVPIIVAVNKMDKAGANPDRVKQQLTEQQLVPEEWGGDTIYVPVSAHTKEGLPQLLEQIYLVAEVAQLKANPLRSATGVVIESRMDKGRGPVATLLVQDGTLKVGQSVVVGTVPGRVRSLIDYKGARVNEAGPSMPVEIQGLSEVPLAGDRFDVTPDDQQAETIAAARRASLQSTEVKGKVSLEDIFSKLKQGDVKELAIVLKSDMAGSSEAIKGMLAKVGTTEVKVKLVHAAVGGINESDVLLASSAKGIVVGFNTRPDGGAQTAAKRLGVEIKTYTIVYEMMDDLKKALAGMLTPDIVEKQLGRAEVRNIFSVPKIGVIAGSFVTEGKIARNAEVRLIRDGKIVYTGKLGSLKRFKDDAREVAQGYECGIGIENFNDLKIGDIVEAFNRESVVREL